MNYATQIKQFVIFSGGSLIGAIIDYCVTFTLIHSLDLDAVIALACAMAISASVVFVFHDKVTFNSIEKKRKLKTRYLSFLAVAFGIFVMRALMLKLLIYIGIHINIALALSLIIVSIINFIISSTTIFAKYKS